VDVKFSAASNAGLNCVKGGSEVLREAVFEVVWERFAEELFLYADGGLFAPDGKLLYERD
jgi:hypothetical protein